MKTQVLVATLIGAIVAFFAGYIIWGMLTMDYYNSNISELYVNEISREEPILWMIFVSQIIWALLLAYLFDQMNIRNFMDGMKCGAIIFFLIMAGFDIMFHATSDFFGNHTIIIVDILLNTVFGGIIGGIIGWWLGRGKEASAS
jgi:membrane protein YqaA with SNARE-associated domain